MNKFKAGFIKRATDNGVSNQQAEVLFKEATGLWDTLANPEQARAQLQGYLSRGQQDAGGLGALLGGLGGAGGAALGGAAGAGIGALTTQDPVKRRNRALAMGLLGAGAGGLVGGGVGGGIAGTDGYAQGVQGLEQGLGGMFKSQ